MKTGQKRRCIVPSIRSDNEDTMKMHAHLIALANARNDIETWDTALCGCEVCGHIDNAQSLLNQAYRSFHSAVDAQLKSDQIDGNAPICRGLPPAN